MRIGDFNAAQVGDVNPSFDDEGGLAALAALTGGGDLTSLATEMWAAHAATATRFDQPAAAPLDMPADPWTPEQYYSFVPPEVKLLDERVALAGAVFQGSLLGGAGLAIQTPEMGALTSLAMGTELLGSMSRLSTELTAPKPDAMRVLTAAADADKHLLDFASGGDAGKRTVMAGAYGSSATGGGAFGNEVARIIMAAFFDALSQAQSGQIVNADPQGVSEAQDVPEQQFEDLLQQMLAGKGGAQGGAPAATGGAHASGAHPAAHGHGHKPAHGHKPGHSGKHPAAHGHKPGHSGKHPAVGHGHGHKPAHSGKHPSVGGAHGSHGSTRGKQARLAALARANTQVGVREATGNNDGVPSQRYSNGQKEPWCANFVAWNYRTSGHPLPGNQDAIGSCTTMARELKAHGQYYGKEHTPEPGDIIFFGRYGDFHHVGLVDHVANGRVYTVEGNSGNKVSKNSYPLSYGDIGGYARPE